MAKKLKKTPAKKKDVKPPEPATPVRQFVISEMPDGSSSISWMGMTDLELLGWIRLRLKPLEVDAFIQSIEARISLGPKGTKKG